MGNCTAPRPHSYREDDSPGRESAARRRPAAALLAAVVMLGALACSEPRRMPSILLVSIDTLRADHLGLYGYERDTSPNLDRWARRGLVYEQVFTPAAWTLVAHMSMLTGYFPEQHGVLEGGLALGPDVALLSERLAGVGYHTLGLYQPTWVHPRHGFGRGFEVFRSHESAEEAGQHLFEELDDVPAGQPWFAFLHLFDVHSDPDELGSVYSTPPEFRDLFVPGAAEQLAGQTYLSLKHRKQKFDAHEREALIALYDEGVRHIDARLGEWLARLEREGLLENTVVIITSDHGESLAQRGPLGGHGGVRQEGLHVPLLLRLPGDARAGTRVPEAAHLVDLVPTVLDCIGLPLDPDLPGHSLLGPLPAERILVGDNLKLGYVVRWPLKWIQRHGHTARVDLAADPLELDSQPIESAEYEAMRAQLALPPGTLHAGVSFGDLSPEDAAALRALGYGGEVDGQ